MTTANRRQTNGSRIRRGLWVITLCGLTCSLPAIASGQPTKSIPRIGYLSFYSDERDKLMAAFYQGLIDLGYRDGKDILIEKRDANDNLKRAATLIDELIQLNVDLIVTGPLGANFAKKSNSTIPLVLPYSADPVNDGLVASLARPGGNITGLSDYHADLVTKRLELLKEIAPSSLHVAVLYNPKNRANSPMIHDTNKAARAFGITIVPTPIENSGDIDRAFSKMPGGRVGGLLQFVGLGAFRKKITDLAAQHRIPTIYTRAE